MRLCSNKEVAGIFSFFILIYVFLGGFEQCFKSRARLFFMIYLQRSYTLALPFL